MKRLIILFVVPFLSLWIAACGSSESLDGGRTVQTDATMKTAIENEVESDEQEADQPGQAEEAVGSESAEITDASETGVISDEEENSAMVMKIGDTPVQVIWEDNESVEALKELIGDSDLNIQMSMYGGFEQVGSIGQSLPRNDAQTTTKAGDIVLYSGNQMVVFYGSNSWAYTRLGHISDKNEDELAELLGNGDVTITIEMGGK